MPVNEQDEAAIREVLGGKTGSFADLIERHKALVFSIVTRHVPYDQADEVAQDVFVRVYRALPGFRGAGSFEGWLRRIAVRECLDFLRKRYRRRELSSADWSAGDAELFESALADQALEEFEVARRRAVVRKMLDTALHELKPEERMVLTLVYFEDLDLKEAAAQLGWSLVNLKVRLFRARRKLRRVLERLQKQKEQPDE